MSARAKRVGSMYIYADGRHARIVTLHIDDTMWRKFSIHCDRVGLTKTSEMSAAVEAFIAFTLAQIQ